MTGPSGMTVPSGTAPAPAPVPAPAAPDRPRHPARWIAGGVLALGALLVAVLATRPPAAATEVDTPLLGRPAPALAGTTLDGSFFDLAALRGRWVVINFFASWCPPCQQEEPALVAFARQHRGPQSPALVGVAYDDTVSAAQRFMAGAGAGWPALADPGGTMAVDYGVRAPPETFIVSPAGLVVVHLDGPVSTSQLDYWLAQAAGGAP
jgi:cytochrome c biogenesis protein CcmG/thiol:disulfide interchange protein DsbE